MLIAVKQCLPDADVALGAVKVKCRHLPALHLAVMLAAGRVGWRGGGYRVWGEVWGEGSRVQDVGCMVSGVECGV
jgi:hypothetical protein